MPEISSVQAAGLALVAGVGIAYLSIRQRQQVRIVPCSDPQIRQQSRLSPLHWSAPLIMLPDCARAAVQRQSVCAELPCKVLNMDPDHVCAMTG